MHAERRRTLSYIGLLGVFIWVASNGALPENTIQSSESYVPGTVITIAGSGPVESTETGDGNFATEAFLSGPWAITVDRSGQLLIGEPRTSRIRQVDEEGIITTVVGTGRRGYSGDGGFAAQAQVNEPCGLAFDAEGNLYFTDNDNWRVRKVSSQGTISTLAGSGHEGFSGDGGPGNLAELSYPQGIVADGEGGVYFVDQGNNRVRKVGSDGGITTVAGCGNRGFSGDGGPAQEARLDGPMDVALDQEGNLFVSDTGNNRVRKVDSRGLISTVVGNGEIGFSGDGGPAVSAQLHYPFGVAVLGSGDLLVTTYDNRVRRVDDAGIITKVAGTGEAGFGGDGGPAVNAKLNRPYDIAVDHQRNWFIADLRNLRVRKVTPEGIITTVAGRGRPKGRTVVFSGDGSAADSARLNRPAGLAMDSAGSLYIADRSNHRIRKVTVDGIIRTVAGNGVEGFSGESVAASSAQLSDPWGICPDMRGNLFVADSGNHRIRRVDPDGFITTVAGTGEAGFGGDGGPARLSRLKYPTSIAVDPSGTLYVADLENDRVRKVSPEGIISTIAGTGFGGYSGDGGSATEAQLDNPIAVVLDQSGNLFIADLFNNVVRKVTPDGLIKTVAGHKTRQKGFTGDGGAATLATLFNPSGIAVDPEGNLFISDRLNDCVRVVTIDGKIKTVVGNSMLPAGYSGDGGPGGQAQLNRPVGLALDLEGNLYVADGNNHRIRKVMKLAP